MSEAIQIMTDASGNEHGVLLPPLSEVDSARSELQGMLESLVEAMDSAGAPAASYRGNTAAAEESIKHWKEVARQRRAAREGEE